MKDIYNRLPTDQTYIAQLETDDEIEQIIQQIKMVLGTKPGDILCEPTFGVDIKKYLFAYTYNQEEINEIVKNGILENIYYDESKYYVDITVDFGQDYDSGTDYACVNININQTPIVGVIINQDN